STYTVQPNRHPFPTRRSSDLIDKYPNIIKFLNTSTSYIKETRSKSNTSGSGIEYYLKYKQKFIDSIELEEVSINAKYNIQSVDKDRKSTRLNSSHVSISYAVF